MPAPSDYPKDQFFYSLGLSGPGVIHPKKRVQSKGVSGTSKKMNAALSKGFKSKVLAKIQPPA